MPVKMLNVTDITPYNFGISSLLQIIVLQYFGHLHSTCFIGKSAKDDLLGNLNIPYPSVWLAFDESNEILFLNSIEAGCQSFVLTESVALNFLEIFESIHDQATHRFPNKYVIVLVSPGSDLTVINRIIDHKTLRDIPRFLTLFPSEDDRIDLITNRFVRGGTEPETLDSYIPSRGSFVHKRNLFPDKLQNLEGRLLRLAIFNYSPYTVWKDANSSRNSNAYNQGIPELYVDGTETQIFLEFCAKFNCKLEISLDEASEWGEIYDNRTGNGIIGAVVERRADVGVGALYSWHHENLYLTLSKPISRTGVTCITPKPRLLSSWMTPILPFSLILWIAVLTTFAIMSIVLMFMEYLIQNVLLEHDRPLDICTSFMTIGCIFILQTVRLSINRNVFVSQKIVVGSLLFVGLMIGNTYSGGLSSVMTIPRYEPPINTVQDLADSNMHWASTHDAWIFSILMATQPTIVKLLHNFEKHPKESLHRSALHQDFSFSIERLPYGHFAVGEYIDKETADKYHFMIEDIYWENCVAMSTKTWPMMEHLDELILVIFQSGIQRYWEQRVVSSYEDEKVQLAISTSRHRESPGPITLEPSHLLGAFLMLAIGLVGGCVVFLLEVLYVKWKNRYFIFRRSRKF
ncbi:glutamate receptor ionotropic, delta-2-like [Topomyia yanbarensis]|uniref:glutamate receptor ionotropic, delta-2-like n=1 Tax=Topomyia yanbarensis TaxID=2498891 RepID=UPI00273C50F3|nr:glutamate receptor ionotropic, delta-2-like [Topomyia yanbarensis]